MENAIIYFFSTSSPVKNALELNALLWPAMHTLPNRIYMSKEETRCQEKKIHNFLLFPFLSRTTLLWGTNQGLVTIHYTIFSILTASKNQKPGRVNEDGPIIPRKAGAFVVGIRCLESRSPSNKQESIEKIKTCRSFNYYIFYSSLAETLAVWEWVVGNKGIKGGGYRLWGLQRAREGCNQFSGQLWIQGEFPWRSVMWVYPMQVNWKTQESRR